MQSELRTRSLKESGTGTSKKETFLQILESELGRLKNSGFLTAQDADEKRNLARDIPEDQLGEDLHFAAEVWASSLPAPHREHPRETMVIDMKKYIAMAHALEDKHRDQMYDDREEAINGHSNRNIISALGKFPREILAHYFGHGVRNAPNTLAATLSILDNNLFVGEVGHLVPGYEACYAYTDGDLLIISHRNKSLMAEGTGGVQVTIEDKRMVGTKIDSGVAFVCNVAFDSLVDDLRILFPDKTILRASELVDYIEAEERAALSKS